MSSPESVAEIESFVVPPETGVKQESPSLECKPDVTTNPSALEKNGEQSSKAKKPWSFHLAFVGLSLAVFVFQLDATALSTSLPTVAIDLKGTSLESFWANICYTLCVVVTQPQWATWSDVFGRKIPLYLSMALFAVGSLIFALAKNMGTIIAGRLLQGLGGGGIDVLAEIILADMTTLQERSKYLGMMALPISIGNILGPSVGALFTTYVSWRWLGWVNLPVLGVASPMLLFFLRLRSVNPEGSLGTTLKRLDWLGMCLWVIGVTIFVLPLSWAGSLYSWSSWRTLLPLICGAVVLVTFAVYERYPSSPLMPHRFFGSLTANMTLAGGFVHGMILFSVLLYLPLFYQAVNLESPIGAAVSLLPTSVTSVAVAAGSMILISIVGGGYRWVIRTSWVLLTLGAGILTLLDLDSNSSMRLGIPIVWGAGVALLRLLLLPIQASVNDVNDTGLAIAQLLTFRLLGGLVGLSIGSTVFNTVFSDAMSSFHRPAGPLDVLNNAKDAIAFIPELRKVDISREVLDGVVGIYLKSFRAVFYTMTGLGGLGLVTSLFIKDLDLDRTDRGRQHFED